MRRANQGKARARKKAPALPLPSYIESGVALLDAMSNATRLIALDALSKQEQPVGQISALLGLSQSATSQHLRILKKAGLLTSRRRAQSVFYSCQSQPALAVLNVLIDLFPAAGLTLQQQPMDTGEIYVLDAEALEKAT